MGIKIALCDLIPQACNHAPYYMMELVVTGITETANSEVSSMTHESFEEMDGMLTPPIEGIASTAEIAENYLYAQGY